MTNIKHRKYKMSRRIQTSLWGREKDPANKKNYRPGQHGRSLFRSFSEFGKQMTAKQCFKWYYNIREKQFKRIFDKAYKKRENTSDTLVGLLESRLSAILYNSSLVPTIFTSQQFVSHKHVLVNDKVINLSSYNVKVGDIVSLRERAKNLPSVLQAIAQKERDVPAYLEVDVEKRQIKFIKVPTFAEVPYPTTMQPNMVVEFYSR